MKEKTHELVAALEEVTKRLTDWVEIADKEDIREADYAALRQAHTALDNAKTDGSADDSDGTCQTLPPCDKQVTKMCQTNERETTNANPV